MRAANKIHEFIYNANKLGKLKARSRKRTSANYVELLYYRRMVGNKCLFDFDASFKDNTNDDDDNSLCAM